jgi:uncharacterized protein DUF4129
VTHPPDSAALRSLAAHILSQRRFGGRPLGQPFQPALNQFGRWLDDFISFISGLPGGVGVAWVVIAVVVLSAAVFSSRRWLRRLAPAEALGTIRRRSLAGEDPQALERDAAAAEERGAFAEAVRLRFRAGLLALGARGVIPYSSSVRTNQVARRLQSADFEALAKTFEHVTYGGASAGEDDATAAREGWRRVLAGAKG